MNKEEDNFEDDEMLDSENDNFESDDSEDSENNSADKNDESDDSDTDINDLIGDDSDIDIIIEITEDDIEIELKTKEEDIILSKHKVQGKHSLKYDSIFKGKKEEKAEEDYSGMYYNEKFEVDKASFFYVESFDNESYIRQKNVKEKVYNVLLKNTSINFLNNRRKPSKSDFNHYYFLLNTHLKDDGFTNVELFNELSVYFSDNLFNMFKLLDNKWRNSIIIELQEHIGKNINSKEIKNRNIYIGTEIEFKHLDPLDEWKTYTGVVFETDYENSYFKVDSFENIYEIHLSDITKILNNTKFRYNLNKLDNIDFL
jgi:hypothetical protein